MKNWSVLFLAYLLVISCKTKESIPDVSPDLIEFSLKKGGCYGNCPIYNLEIYGGGEALFFGERNTEKLGKYSKNIGELEYNALRERAAKLDIWEFKDSYESNIPDLPLVVIGLRDKKGMKTMSGKEDRPEELMKIQAILEGIAEGEDWTFLEDLNGVTAEEKANYIMTEIIIEPGPGTLLPHFFEDVKKRYGMRILNRISPTSNLWLTTYDTNRIDGEELLEILKNDKRLSSAEFNKKIKPRSND